MTTETGRVLAVTAYPLGDELVATATAGATTLTVSDPVDFNEEGGVLRLAESEVIVYTAADDETGVLTLASPVAAEAAEGEVVEVWDPASATVAHEFVAMVALEGEDQDADALEATIPHALIPYLEEGVRGDRTEFVSLEWRGEELVVRDVLHRDPVIGADYLPEQEQAEPGNSVYRGETPPWPDGDTAHADDDGDLWWQTSTITHEDGSTSETFTPFIWDGTGLAWVDASDPEVDLVSGRLDDNDNAISDLSASVENAEETATKARDIASTADGRVSFSDYDPAPDDVTYEARDENGNVILGEDGNPVILTRNPGSVWYTRTRERRNLCPNPSFEVDLAGWGITAATATQHDPADPTVPIAGTYALRMANDATTNGEASWAGGSPGLPVSPGQTYSVSTFALSESGAGLGAYALIRFYDGAGALVEEVTGDPVDLLTDDWLELDVTATVPTGAAHMVSAFRNPNASDVWLIDGVLVEAAEYTGRYFDGESYDSMWDGTPHASTSYMEGGKIISVFELYDSGWVALDFTGSTQYDSDAGDLTKGTLDPDRIAERSLGVEKLATNEVVASEALNQGDLVHVWDNNGLFFVRRASAEGHFEAHGFVLDAVQTGDAVAVYTSGYNPYCLDLTPGPQFLASTPGEATGYPPSAPGRTVQRVGFASDTTTLHFTAALPIRVT